MVSGEGSQKGLVDDLGMNDGISHTILLLNFPVRPVHCRQEAGTSW